MPHIVVEYSRNLQHSVKDNHLLKELHKVVIESDLFSPEAVKARAVAYDDYVMTTPYDSFAHVNISILNGRPLEARKALLESVYAMARGLLPKADKISVNIHEMDADTYKKS